MAESPLPITINLGNCCFYASMQQSSLTSIMNFKIHAFQLRDILS